MQSPTLSVLDYQADPSGASLSTSALQDAIDAAGAAGGGTVFVPPGRYVIGTIRLRSDIRLHIEPGATLAGSHDIRDYTEESEGHNPPEFPYVRCLIVGFDLENVEITGGGTIDGSGAAFMDYATPTYGDAFTPEVLANMPEERRHEYVSEKADMRPTWIIFLRRCRNIRLQGFRIHDVARWSTRFSQCENILVSGMFIDNDLRAANSDGIHFTSCRNIVVSDSSIVSGDDCIAITTYGDEDASSEGAVVTNCILTSHSAGIRIGFGGSLVENVLITNCVFRRCNRGIGIFATEGATVRNVTISGLQMSTRLIAGTWWGKAEPLVISTLGTGGSIENVSVSNISARCEQGVVVNAVEDSSVQDVRLTDLRLHIDAGPMTPYSGGTLDLRPHSMERRAMPGLYAHGVRGLVLRNVEIAISDEARPHFPTPIEHVACEGIEIEGS